MSFSKRGGARVGAGRPKKRDAGIPHDTRPELSGREAVHVTLRVRAHVYNLRSRRCFEVIRNAFFACGGRPGFRVVGVGVEGNHLHLLAEAAGAASLSSGVHALEIRIARGLQRVMGQRGPVFDERFHEHVLRSTEEAARAIAYVAGNTAKHAAQVGRPVPPGYRDPYTVGYFGDSVLLPEGTAGMVAPPETWLLREGWRLAQSSTPVSAARLASATAGPLPLFAWAGRSQTPVPDSRLSGLGTPAIENAAAVALGTSAENATVPAPAERDVSKDRRPATGLEHRDTGWASRSAPAHAVTPEHGRCAEARRRAA